MRELRSSNNIGDVRRFFRAWLSAPLRVAAIMPSGSALAGLITSEISAATGPVIELGAGTGVFTRALIARGVPEDKLVLVEYGADFVQLLEQRFPRARILSADAARLGEVELFDDSDAGAVISGLPLLSMPPRKVMAILDAAFSHLRSDGAFYQFTYGPRCPVPRVLLDRLALKAIRIGGALANVPPAAVYRIRRRPPRSVISMRKTQSRGSTGERLLDLSEA